MGSLSKLFIESVSYIEKNHEELVKEVHRLARLGVHSINFNEGGVAVKNSFVSSLVIKVKQNEIVTHITLIEGCSP